MKAFLKFKIKFNQMKTITDTYIKTLSDQSQIEIEFSAYKDEGNYYNPPEGDAEILKVFYNGVDITQFYKDFIEDTDNSLELDFNEYVKKQL